MAKQLHSMLWAIKALVEAAGGTMDSTMRFNVHMTDMRYWRDWQVMHREVFPQKMPAYTLLQVSSLARPDWLSEIEAIAVL
jgi:2-iminobutanoate/2-iminopropanoate deaminase